MTMLLPVAVPRKHCVNSNPSANPARAQRQQRGVQTPTEARDSTSARFRMRYGESAGVAIENRRGAAEWP